MLKPFTGYAREHICSASNVGEVVRDVRCADSFADPDAKTAPMVTFSQSCMNLTSSEVGQRTLAYMCRRVSGTVAIQAPKLVGIAR